MPASVRENQVTTRERFRGQWLGISERDGWEFATRTNASAVAVLIPVTDAGDLVLVEQYRIPVRARVIELPAGLAGDGEHAGESLLNAAARELEEETGYVAQRLEWLLECPSTAGLSDEVVTFFVARGLERVGPGGGDASEDIRVHLVPLQNAGEWLGQQQAAGKLLDPKVFSALYFIEHGEGLTFSAPA
jgi:ADP-ribose pyrophosphatase